MDYTEIEEKHKNTNILSRPAFVEGIVLQLTYDVGYTTSVEAGMLHISVSLPPTPRPQPLTC
jgi:hypothetical protein